jgi:hypothetical protein
MNGSVVLDTNILIYLSKKQLDLNMLFLENTTYSISVISKIELLGYTFKNAQELNIITELINALNVISLNDDIVQLTIELRKKYRIKIPDAIVYATAQSLDGMLYTNNVADFTNINEKVALVNPMPQ